MQRPPEEFDEYNIDHVKEELQQRQLRRTVDRIVSSMGLSLRIPSRMHYVKDWSASRLVLGWAMRQA